MNLFCVRTAYSMYSFVGSYRCACICGDLSIYLLFFFLFSFCVFCIVSWAYVLYYLPNEWAAHKDVEEIISATEANVDNKMGNLYICLTGKNFPLLALAMLCCGVKWAKRMSWMNVLFSFQAVLCSNIYGHLFKCDVMLLAIEIISGLCTMNIATAKLAQINITAMKTHERSEQTTTATTTKKKNVKVFYFSTFKQLIFYWLLSLSFVPLAFILSQHNLQINDL